LEPDNSVSAQAARKATPRGKTERACHMVFVLLSKLFCFAGWSIAAAGNVMRNTKRTIAPCVPGAAQRGHAMAFRDGKRSAVLSRTGTVTDTELASTAYGTVPDQRCTATQRNQACADCVNLSALPRAAPHPGHEAVSQMHIPVIAITPRRRPPH